VHQLVNKKNFDNIQMLHGTYVDIILNFVWRGTRFHRMMESKFIFLMLYLPELPPLWSSGQSFWLQIQRSQVRFPALPDFLSSSGSGTGSTQPRETREVN
jgi:hypothetical protein